jgi:hypothetical protein
MNWTCVIGEKRLVELDADDVGYVHDREVEGLVGIEIGDVRASPAQPRAPRSCRCSTEPALEPKEKIASRPFGLRSLTQSGMPSCSGASSGERLGRDDEPPHMAQARVSSA